MTRQKAVKIAVIDSGINPFHSHIGGVAGGVSIQVGKAMQLELRADYRDRLGHGTAVAAAIRDEMPACELYAVRVFDETLATYPTVLCAALEWAIDNHMDIVNLSLGSTQDHEELRALCREAHDTGIIVVAAMDELRGMPYPAEFEGVLAVTAGELLPGQYRFLGGNRFACCGYPRELTGDVQRYNLHGHSFAAARLSGIIGRRLAACEGDVAYREVKAFMSTRYVNGQI